MKWAMTNTDNPVQAPLLILNEARELRRRQDERLKTLQTLSKGLLAGFLSGGAIAVAAANGSRASFAASIFGCAAVMLLLAVFAEVPVRNWKEGPDLRRLIEDFLAGTYRAHGPAMDLVITFKDHYDFNEGLVGRVRVCVALQGMTALIGFGNLSVWLLQIA